MANGGIMLGSVVKLKNIIFKKYKGEKRCSIDHARLQGRPAIVICETEDKIYHLLVTHHDFKELINIRDYKLVKGLGIDGFVKLDEIHSRPLCFEEEYNILSEEILLDILKCFCSYQEMHDKDEEYEEIRPYVYKKVCDLSRKYEKR